MWQTDWFRHLPRITNQVFLGGGVQTASLSVNSYDCRSLGNIKNWSPEGKGSCWRRDLNTDSQGSALPSNLSQQRRENQNGGWRISQSIQLRFRKIDLLPTKCPELPKQVPERRDVIRPFHQANQRKQSAEMTTMRTMRTMRTMTNLS